MVFAIGDKETYFITVNFEFFSQNILMEQDNPILLEILKKELDRLSYYERDLSEDLDYRDRKDKINVLERELEEVEKDFKAKSVRNNYLKSQIKIIEDKNSQVKKRREEIEDKRRQKIKDKLIKEKLESGTLFDFRGDDKCDECDGWDGVSRRCECGNRRVDWELNEYETEIYAEAY